MAFQVFRAITILSDSKYWPQITCFNALDTTVGTITLAASYPAQNEAFAHAEKLANTLNKAVEESCNLYGLVIV